MGDSLTRVTNACGQVIEVGRTYRVNDVSPEQACKKREAGIEVKVVQIKSFGNGIIMAKLDYPRNSQDNIFLSWIVIDRLYSTSLVAGTFRPLDSYTDPIRRA
jgi:hypothetical protein